MQVFPKLKLELFHFLKSDSTANQSISRAHQLYTKLSFTIGLLKYLLDKPTR